jgi:hypothetical protein
MVKEKKLTDWLIENINRVGNLSVADWFNDNQIDIGSKGNFFDLLEKALNDNTISESQIKQAIAELEENGSKKIFLMEVKKFNDFEEDKTNIVSRLQNKFGITLSETNYITGAPKERPTFIYLHWKDHILKIKYMEKQFEIEADFEKEEFKRIPKTVCVLYSINTQNGLTQIRYDNSFAKHTHKNDENKSSEVAYEQYYKDHLKDLFPDIVFTEMDLNAVANYISKKEKIAFRLNKGVSTITNGAKQTFATATNKSDVRDLPEYEAAASKGIAIWRSEDLTGYWLASQSNGELNRDLFMRISRRQAQIRVQRGCLEKELNYGIEQIRKIQKGV